MKFERIVKYNDLETLTQERIDSELARLLGEIERVKQTLIYKSLLNMKNYSTRKFKSN